MKCPNCGTLEQGRVRVCQTCGTAYASEDLLELRQLEFLLIETASWPEADLRSKQYADRLDALKARILPATPPAALTGAVTGVIGCSSTFASFTSRRSRFRMSWNVHPVSS